MATLYYNAADDTDWSNLDNWWTNEALTNQATSLPSSSDSVVLLNAVSTNSGGPITVVDLLVEDIGDYPVIAIEITVTGLATFNDGELDQGIINGNCVFNGNAWNYDGTVNGDCTFNDDSINGSRVNGNATFNNLSSNSFDGYIEGNVTFNDDSYNEGYILGTASFNESSYNWNEVDGDAIFNDTTINGSDAFMGIAKNATFNDEAFQDIYGVVIQDAVFNNSSYNLGLVDGNALFNSLSYNDGGMIFENATFELSSAAIMIENALPGTYGSIDFKYEKGINGSSILGLI